MSELGFGNNSDFYLKIESLGPLLVRFLIEIWSDKSLILRFIGLIFCLAALPPWKVIGFGPKWWNFNMLGNVFEPMLIVQLCWAEYRG